jgi:DNA-binding transcriptional ArsR family regulator
MSTARARRQRSREEDRLDLVFGALSDRTRRALLARLGNGPAKITDLAAPFRMSLPAVSKHVRVLERAGLVAREVDGRVHRCALDVRPLEDADRWLSRHRVLWEDSLEALARHVEGEDDRE